MPVIEKGARTTEGWAESLTRTERRGLAAAGIVLVRSDPRDVAAVIRLSRATYHKMVQNLAWAVGYNVIALPLAAGAFAWAGLVLPAWAGAVLMSASTVVVAINARLLRLPKGRAA